MFEKFNVSNFYVSMQSKLSLYGSGRGSGVLVDIGEGVSHVAIIYEGNDTNLYNLSVWSA